MTEFAETHLAKFYPHLLETHSPQASVPNTPSPDGITEDSARKDKGGLTCEDESPADTHTPEENNTAFLYPSRELSNFQDSSGEEAETSFEKNLSSSVISASAYQENKLDGQTLIDEAETKIIWK